MGDGSGDTKKTPSTGGLFGGLGGDGDLDRDLIDKCDALAYPVHDGNGHAVAESGVSWGVGGFGDGGVVVRETLKPFALDGGEASDAETGAEHGFGLEIFALAVAFGHALGDMLVIRENVPVAWHAVFPCVTGVIVAVSACDRGGYEGRAASGAVFAGVASRGAEGVGRLRLRLIRHFGEAPVGVEVAVSSSAFRSEVGSLSSFPRFAARRRIPRQAFALKKYRCGTLPESSRMCDKEDSAAALWNSEVLSVKNAVGEPIPELSQRPEEGAKVLSSVGGQDAGHVLPNDPAGAYSASKREELQGQVAARVVQAESFPGDGEGLAGGSSDKNINWSTVFSDLCEVAKVCDVRVAVG